MGQGDKLLNRILTGTSDANSDFNDRCQMLHRLGFDEGNRGSHSIFRKQGMEEMINLQRDGSKVQVYQIRQVRSVILKYKLGGDTDAEV